MALFSHHPIRKSTQERFSNPATTPFNKKSVLTQRRRGLHLGAPPPHVGDQRAWVGVPAVGDQQPEQLRGAAGAGGRAAELAPPGGGAEGADLGDEGCGHEKRRKKKKKRKKRSIERKDERRR